MGCWISFNSAHQGELIDDVTEIKRVEEILEEEKKCTLKPGKNL